MASVTIKVEGLQQLGRNLQQFTREVKEKVLRKAVRTAANEVRDTAKSILIAKGLVSNNPPRPPHIRDAIATRRMSKASRIPGKEFYAVGVFKIKGGTYAKTKHNVRKGRVGKTHLVDPPEFYWKFLELGTVKIPPHKYSFLQPAFNAKKGGSPEVMRKELVAGMERATRKLAKAKK